MADLIEVIFKGNAPCGFDGYGRVETVGSKQLSNFQKAGIYDIEVVAGSADDGDGLPDDNWTKKEIMNYLKFKGVDFKPSQDKATLLGLC